MSTDAANFRQHFRDHPGHVHHVAEYFDGERCATCGATSPDFRMLPSATPDERAFVASVGQVPAAKEGS